MGPTKITVILYGFIMFFIVFLCMIVIYAIFRRGVYVDFIYTIYSSYGITQLSVYVYIYIYSCVCEYPYMFNVMYRFSYVFCCTFVLLSQQWLNKDVQSLIPHDITND